MDILGVLERLENLELAIENMYKSFNQKFFDDIQAAELFRKMGEDERGHLKIVQYQRRIVVGNRRLFDDVEMDLDEVVQVTNEAEKGADISNDLSLDDALKMSIEVEKSAAEHHYHTAMSKANPAFSEMVRSLGSADEEHMGRLEKFLGERYFNTKDLLD